MYLYVHVKGVLDSILALIGLIVLLPVFLIVIAAIKLESPGPAFFKQERLGKDGKVFNIYKFRSMCVGAESGGVYELKGDTRVTKVGKFIRVLSIDEFPQFINILRGEMSIIGPRPTLTYHPWPLEDYSPAQKKRFDVRPGVTGWAQIHGRKGLQWEDRLEYDVEYVQKLSFLLDLKIFFKTIAKVFLMKDNINTSKTTDMKIPLSGENHPVSKKTENPPQSVHTKVST